MKKEHNKKEETLNESTENLRKRFVENLNQKLVTEHFLADLNKMMLKYDFNLINFDALEKITFDQEDSDDNLDFIEVSIFKKQRVLTKKQEKAYTKLVDDSFNPKLNLGQSDLIGKNDPNDQSNDATAPINNIDYKKMIEGLKEATDILESNGNEVTGVYYNNSGVFITLDSLYSKTFSHLEPDQLVSAKNSNESNDEDNNGWKHEDDELPGDYHTVLVWSKEDGVSLAWRSYYHWVWDSDKIKNVTHWKYIGPDPYGENCV